MFFVCDLQGSDDDESDGSGSGSGSGSGKKYPSKGYKKPYGGRHLLQAEAEGKKYGAYGGSSSSSSSSSSGGAYSKKGGSGGSGSGEDSGEDDVSTGRHACVLVSAPRAMPKGSGWLADRLCREVVHAVTADLGRGRCGVCV